MFAVILMVMMMIVGNHFDDLGNGDEKGYCYNMRISGSSWKYNEDRNGELMPITIMVTKQK